MNDQGLLLKTSPLWNFGEGNPQLSKSKIKSNHQG